MHGMTQNEVRKIAEIRAMARSDMPSAKREASRWIMSNKRRSVIRRMACNAIKFINSAS